MLAFWARTLAFKTVQHIKTYGHNSDHSCPLTNLLLLLLLLRSILFTTHSCVETYAPRDILAMVTLLMVISAAGIVAVTGGPGHNELLLSGLLDHLSCTHLDCSPLIVWPEPSKKDNKLF